jgi:hypothetical protein
MSGLSVQNKRMGLLDRLSIKSKLIAMLLAVSGCSIVVITYLGYRSGQRARL